MGADGDWHLVPAYLQATGLIRFTGLFLVKSALSLCSLFRIRFGSWKVRRLNRALEESLYHVFPRLYQMVPKVLYGESQ